MYNQICKTKLPTTEQTKSLYILDSLLFINERYTEGLGTEMIKFNIIRGESS
jgi:hypothetical protein